MNQMEIITTTDLNSIPRVIEWNFEDLKTELRSQLEVYKNLTVTADAIKVAKSDRANLNKLKTAVEEHRKEIKRRCLEPYNVFEAQCKELVGIISEPINAIDEQVKVFEDKEKQDKYDALKAHYDSVVGDMADTAKLDLIINPKWANKTNKLEDLKGEIEDQIDRVKDELKKLSEQYGDAPYYAAIVNKYKEALNYSAAVVLATNLKFEQEQEERRKKKAEEALKAAQEAQAAEEQRIQQMAVQPEPVPMSEPTVAVQPVQQTAPTVNEPVGMVSFTVKGTRSQIVALREFMKKNGIEYAVIRK